MEILKILFFCLAAAILALFLKQYKGEYAVAVSVAAGASVILALIKILLPQISEIGKLLSVFDGAAEYYKTAVKALALGYITSFTADTCRDCGQTALAGKAELTGKCGVLLLALPMLGGILKAALELI